MLSGPDTYEKNENREPNLKEKTGGSGDGAMACATFCPGYASGHGSADGVDHMRVGLSYVIGSALSWLSLFYSLVSPLLSSSLLSASHLSHILLVSV